MIEYKQITDGCYNCANRTARFFFGPGCWCSLHKMRITFPGTCGDHKIDEHVQKFIAASIERLGKKNAKL